MTLALRDLQAAFAAHIAGADRADLTEAVVGESIPAAARLRVYRHHVFYSLASVLGETFPTVKSLVGEAFFRQMARIFVTAQLPEQPVLSEYGASFPGFVAIYESARSLPYLADVARLDWALNLAFHTERVRPLGATDLQAIGVEQLPAQRLGLQVGVGLMESAFPIDRIWTLAQPDAGGEAVDTDAGGVRLLVLPGTDDAAFVALSVGEAAFVAALMARQTLEEAAAHGLAAEAGFDLSTSFARLLGLGAFAALRQG